MQTLGWYIRRLQAMSLDEIVWRTRTSLRIPIDRLLLGRRQHLQPLSEILNGRSCLKTPGFRVSDIELGQWKSVQHGMVERNWLADLLSKADRIVDHQLNLFDLGWHHLGDPIDWNRDHKSSKPSPKVFAPSIDYRDFSVTGDCKFVWEPSRHHQLVVMARAYRASGDVRYAKAVVEQLDSWLEQCPFGIGMQWRSPLEMAIRLINWVWTLDLIHESDLLDGEFRVRLLNSIYRHIWEIARNYSRCSSANNHLIGEAVGAYVACCYFSGMKKSLLWRRESRDKLCQEILAQTFDDGGTREQAIGYHIFVLQLFLIAGLVGRWTGEDFPIEYWNRLEKMFEFVGALSEGGRHLPMFGDADDGYVLDLGGNPRDIRQWLSVAAVLFNRADFKAWAGNYSETARWLLERTDRKVFDSLPSSPSDGVITSRAFPKTGYYLLQYGRGRQRISVVFDCGELGLGPLAGHGHADAMSFTLRAFGQDVLIDPGTYDYFSYPRWREYFRSTRAHNTIVIDGENQSVMLGPFLWGRRAKARCLAWKPSDHGGMVTGEHDGYARLPDPVIHRRTLELNGPNRRLTILDKIIARGRHKVDLYFHLAENCRVFASGPNCYEVDVGPGKVIIQLDPRLSVETLTGSENPIGGWVSRGYHRKKASTTLIGRCQSEGETDLVCQINISENGKTD